MEKNEEDNVEDDDVEEEEEEEENRPQDRDAHFVRACAVEMHFNITLYGNLQVKCRRPTLCASLRSQNALQFIIYTEMCR